MKKCNLPVKILAIHPLGGFIAERIAPDTIGQLTLNRLRYTLGAFGENSRLASNRLRLTASAAARLLTAAPVLPAVKYLPGAGATREQLELELPLSICSRW